MIAGRSELEKYLLEENIFWNDEKAEVVGFFFSCPKYIRRELCVFHNLKKIHGFPFMQVDIEL